MILSLFVKFKRDSCWRPFLKKHRYRWKLRSSKGSGQSTAACHVGQNSSRCHIEAACYMGAAVLAHVARSSRLAAALRWTKLKKSRKYSIVPAIRSVNLWLKEREFAEIRRFFRLKNRSFALLNEAVFSIDCAIRIRHLLTCEKLDG